MKEKRKKYLTASLFVLLFVGAGILIFFRKGLSGKASDNLALQRGVKATCDSTEKEELSADKAIDGDDESLSSRWSSENNWESASHYIELEFPEEISVSFVVLKWERTNVISYQLEGSSDGENWDILENFEQAPAAKRQEIPLAETKKVKFLRLSTNAVSLAEEDYSNLYQNVSLYEFEVYADLPVAYQLPLPEIVSREDGSRYLTMPEAPEGYRLTFLGADYEQIIGDDMEVYHTIQEKEVEVGFLVEDCKGQEEPQTASFTILVPAAAEETVTDSGEKNRMPQVIPSLAEWSGGSGVFVPDEHSRIVVAACLEPERGQSTEDTADTVLKQEEWKQTAEIFADWYAEIMGYEIAVVEGTEDEVRPGDFYLGYGTEEKETEKFLTGVGEEGYACNISDKCVISGTDRQGLYWGTITILQILKQQGTVPKGIIRDYPKYEVRGFGIDVARKPVSMDMLYEIMTTMSWYKMNDLNLHLNDNAILSTSGLTDSIEQAMTAYSAFRVDTSVVNDEGEKLTSKDYFYTTEEVAAFIEAAKQYGISVVPEIDTPAHSLSLTKLFPEYALTVRNEAVDQIDLSNSGAVDLVKGIWRELLNQDTGAFAGADTVNIGMDEYYGDGERYRQYMNEILELVQEKSGKQVRLWGSLSNMGGQTMPPADKIQMNVWSDIWADPMEMYQAGYSIINMQNNHLYIIPGGGYDYLDTEDLYANWEPNKFYDYNQLEIIPAYSKQMLGAAYMIWNDMCDNLDVGISEYDLFHRFYQPLGILSGKLWGEIGGEIPYGDWMQRMEKIGTAPGSNPYAQAVWQAEEQEEDAASRNTFTLLEPEEILTLQGRNDYLETDYPDKNDGCVGIGGSYRITMQVYRDEETVSAEKSGQLLAEEEPLEEILLEADSTYGQTAFKAVQTETGQVGFSREGRDYSFDYVLPAGEWVTLEIEGKQNQTSLYVNGVLTDTLGDAEPFTEYATFVFPLERIGSQTNSFRGMIKGVQVTAEQTGRME